MCQTSSQLCEASALSDTRGGAAGQRARSRGLARLEAQGTYKRGGAMGERLAGAEGAKRLHPMSPAPVMVSERVI
jgi:hypothetical protein